MTSDINNGASLEKYVNSQDQFTTVGVSTPSVSANNIFFIHQDVFGAISYAALSSGYNGTGNGVNLGASGAINVLVQQTSGSETDLAIGGTFAGAGGYTNNGSFAVYRDGYNGWADYFYYPSAALPSGTANAYILSFPTSDTIRVDGTAISAFWDQYGDHPGVRATWNISSHYFRFFRHFLVNFHWAG